MLSRSAGPNGMHLTAIRQDTSNRYDLTCRTGLDRTGPDWTGLDWTGLDWTGPHCNRIPVIVLCAYATKITLNSYWATKMDHVVVELLTTNNNEGI